MRFLTVVFLLITLQSYTQTKEPHLKNLKQLTFGGDNAEAYFSYDGKQLVYQTNNSAWGLKCDQIYRMNIQEVIQKGKSYQAKRISTGKGKTTCSYFLKDNKRILYASTHLVHDSCPPPTPPHPEKKYLWSLHPEFDIFVANASGKIIKQLTNTPGYDAEATVSPQGDKIVFTSVRNGDLDLYVMDTDGSNVRQITHEIGYDGGAFFSPDGKQLIFRASRPKTADEIQEYKQLLAQGLVAPTNMEIFICDVDGGNLRQITSLGKANWAPFFHPSGKKILFSSNHHSSKGYDFQLYMINTDGSGLERITNESVFNAFPMFSPDGKKLVFSSNRNNGGTRDTNVFIADWVEDVEK